MNLRYNNCKSLEFQESQMQSSMTLTVEDDEFVLSTSVITSFRLEHLGLVASRCRLIVQAEAEWLTCNAKG